MQKVKTLVGNSLKILNEPSTSWAAANALSGYVAGGIGLIAGTLLFIGGILNSACSIWKSSRPNPADPLPENTNRILKFFSQPSSYFLYASACTAILAVAHILSALHQWGKIDLSNLPSAFQIPKNGISVSVLLAGWGIGQTKANLQFGLRLNKMAAAQEPAKPTKIKLAFFPLIATTMIAAQSQNSPQPKTSTDTAIVYLARANMMQR